MDGGRFRGFDVLDLSTRSGGTAGGAFRALFVPNVGGFGRFCRSVRVGKVHV